MLIDESRISPHLQKCAQLSIQSSIFSFILAMHYVMQFKPYTWNKFLSVVQQLLRSTQAIRRREIYLVSIKRSLFKINLDCLIRDLTKNLQNKNSWDLPYNEIEYYRFYLPCENSEFDLDHQVTIQSTQVNPSVASNITFR